MATLFFRRFTLFFILCVGLSACGWQLRGYQEFQARGSKPLESVKVNSSVDNRLFEAALKRQLEDLGVQLDRAAPVAVELKEERTERRPLSYGSTGIPVQYQLIMSVDVAIVRQPANTNTLAQTLIARRQYDFDVGLVVAKNEEEKVLLQEMREELASRIITLLYDMP